MRYSKGAASLISTAFAFRAKSLVVADIFDLSNDANTEKCKAGKIDCGHGKLCAATNNNVADTGILIPADTYASTGIAMASSCDAGFVKCRNGVVEDDPGTTCFESCGKSCCTYYDFLTPEYKDACKGFTGHVCKDGKSCNGDQACEDANIEYVVKSCTGYQACYKAGSNTGLISEIADS